MPELHVMRSSFFRVLAGLFGAYVVSVCTETLLSCLYAGIWALFSLPLGSSNAADGLSFIATTALYASAIVSLPAIAFVALPHFWAMDDLCAGTPASGPVRPS